MRKKKFIERVLSLLFTLVILIPSLSFSLRADNDTSETESGDGQALTNPVEGLLDPDPVNLPIVGADSYLIYDASSDTKLIGYKYDNLRAPAAITQIMTVLISLEELELSDTITITNGTTVPSTLSKGSAVSVKGTITASSNLTSVTVCICDANGSAVYSKTVAPNAKSYTISKDIDNAMLFNRLAAGNYSYRVIASTANTSNYVVVNQAFTVK